MFLKIIIKIMCFATSNFCFSNSFIANIGLLYNVIQLECKFLKAGTNIWLHFPVEILVDIFKEKKFF